MRSPYCLSWSRLLHPHFRLCCFLGQIILDIECIRPTWKKFFFWYQSFGQRSTRQIVLFWHIFCKLRVVRQVVLFLIRVEICDLEYVFSNPNFSGGAKGRVNIFLTLVPLLTQTSIFFYLFPSIFVRGFAVSSNWVVGRLQCRRVFFDKVIAGFLGLESFRLG